MIVTFILLNDGNPYFSKQHGPYKAVRVQCDALEVRKEGMWHTLALLDGFEWVEGADFWDAFEISVRP